MSGPFARSKNVATGLELSSLEFDQRLASAFASTSFGTDGGFASDRFVFENILRLNTLLSRCVSIDLDAYHRAAMRSGPAKPLGAAPDQAPASHLLEKVLDDAVALLPVGEKTLGTRVFLEALIRRARLPHLERPFSVSILCELLSGRIEARLDEVPELTSILDRLRRERDTAEDFQYFLTIAADGRVAFRVSSVLDDYIQSPQSGLLLPQRAILTHFQDRFGGFTVDEIAELEELINNPRVGETEIQRFFEAHPHFLRFHDYREVHGHVCLCRPDPDGPLVPDFLLMDREIQKAALAELKLPAARMIRDQKNRRRFSAAVLEARAQLLEYRDWFREKDNRARLASTVHMEVYEPKLVVIIGRASEFVDAIDRQKLAASLPDLEVVTYDDILGAARRRRIQIEHSAA